MLLWRNCCVRVICCVLFLHTCLHIQFRTTDENFSLKHLGTLFSEFLSFILEFQGLNLKFVIVLVCFSCNYIYIHKRLLCYILHNFNITWKCWTMVKLGYLSCVVRNGPSLVWYLWLAGRRPIMHGVVRKAKVQVLCGMTG